MSSEKFCLRWNDFESNISTAFRELREDKDFFDVTIACDDEQIQAHKVILSACSPFFRNVLRRNPHQHPLLYLKGVKYTDLQSVLNFMYHGEVNVAQEELNSFLAVAEDLKVKGLTQNSQGGGGGGSAQSKRPRTPPPPKSNSRPPDLGGGSVVSEPTPPPKRPRPNPQLHHQTNNSHHLQEDDDEIQEVVPVKSEPRELPPQVVTQPLVAEQPQQTPEHALASYSGYEEDYCQYEGGEDQYDQNMMVGAAGPDNNKGNRDLISSCFQKLEDNLFQCMMCSKTCARRDNIVNHIENIHYPGSYTCPICHGVFNSQNTLYVHMGRKHKEDKQFGYNAISSQSH